MSSQRRRIGVQIVPDDPFWVQVQEALERATRRLPIDPVPLESYYDAPTTAAERAAMIEAILALDLDALIGYALPDEVIYGLLDKGLPIVRLLESPIRHPLYASPTGWYECGQLAGEFLSAQLPGPATILVTGKLIESDSRIAGLRMALARRPDLLIELVDTSWSHDAARAALLAALAARCAPVDALFGLSDSVALAGYEAAQTLGCCDDHSLFVGLNGDPLALAAIIEGHLAATVDTPADNLAVQAVALAHRAATGAAIPAHFHCRPQLVTAAEAAGVAARKLVATAGLPSRLVGVNRHQEHQRMSQLEASLEINRQAGLLHEAGQLACVVAAILRRTFRYEVVRLLRWRPDERRLVVEGAAADPPGALDPATSPPLAQALADGAPVFIPDTRRSYRFPPDPAWPDSRARLVVPIHVGGQIIGLLDMHTTTPAQLSRHDLVGFQSLADQIGIALHNADLYAAAVAARAAAEQADRLKTRLLANVSHELRTPLNLIIGYTQVALTDANAYATPLPAQLRADLGHVYRAGEHLIGLINDLLDLSAAEIDHLKLLPAPLSPGDFLTEVFRSVANLGEGADDLRWTLELSPSLPLIEADAMRLRQVLLNLLGNARTFTRHGRITLGAEVELPHLHIWVRDTGVGIAPELQAQVFEPFVTGAGDERRPEGVGLGLAIARRLVGLHGGALTLESRPGHGSTFHIYLPLPTLAGRPARAGNATGPALLIGAAYPTPAVARHCRSRGWALRPLSTPEQVDAALAAGPPAALLWELADGRPEAWAVFERLRRHPVACQAPLLLFGPDDQAAPQTNLLTKPVPAQTLAHFIAALSPERAGAPILIVDDDPRTCDFYRTVVAGALPGHPIIVATGGAAAIAACAAQPPALVLLDLVMPEVDGFAVLAQLRAAPATRQTPVIVLSGKLLTDDDLRRLDHARVTVHSKDVLREDEIGERMRRILDGASQPAGQTSALVRRACAYIQQHHARALSRQEIAQAVGVSPYYLSHIFQHELGLAPWEYLQRYRIARARELLQTSALNVTQIAAQVGFDDASYFGRVFRKHVGRSPQAFRDAPNSP